MLIKMTNLSKIYRLGEVEVRAVDKINLEISSGEFVAIMGPSGSGKSTLMHILGCLDLPTSGIYSFADNDVSKMNDNELAVIRSERVGFVFQQFNLLARTTALENVMLPMVYAGKSNRFNKAMQTLEVVGLGGRAKHMSNQLSGGQQQRVAIARSLVNNPDIILADEPTGALDTQSGDEVMAIFERLNLENKTIILITHEPYIAAHAQRIIHVKDGHIVADKINDERIIKELKDVKS